MNLRRSGPVLVCALLSLGLTVSARPSTADDPFDVMASNGTVTTTAHGGWHVNKDYPWRATVGERSFDKAKFSFTETSATVSGLPAGTARLKGAVCNGPQCLPFAKDVAIQ
jgi:hypothetical protein